MLKLILVDDEIADLNNLTALLKSCGEDLHIVATCSSVPEAVKATNTYKPDIVFTDIEMPGLSGIQLLDFFNREAVDFELIFTTSYSEYAVKAFQLSAIDYLLKPVDIELLKSAIDKVRKKQNYNIRERSELLKENLANTTLKRIAIPYAGGIHFIDTDNILYLKADNVYTDIILVDKQVLTVSKPLKDFDKLLPKAQFFRCHRSYMVNINAVKEYITAAGGELVMSNNAVIPLARERKDDFIAIWKK